MLKSIQLQPMIIHLLKTLITFPAYLCPFSQPSQSRLTILQEKNTPIFVSLMVSPARDNSFWWREESWCLNLGSTREEPPWLCRARGCCAVSSVKPNSWSFSGIKTACSVPGCLHFLCLNVKSYSIVDLKDDWVIFKPLDVFQSLYFTLD